MGVRKRGWFRKLEMTDVQRVSPGMGTMDRPMAPKRDNCDQVTKELVL